MMKIIRKLALILGVLTLLASVAALIVNWEENLELGRAPHEFLFILRPALVLFILAFVVKVVFGSGAEVEEGDEPAVGSRRRGAVVASKVLVILAMVTLPGGFVAFLFADPLSDFDRLFIAFMLASMKISVALLLLALLLRVLADRFRGALTIGEGVQAGGVLGTRISKHSAGIFLGLLLMAAITYLPSPDDVIETDDLDDDGGGLFMPTSPPSIPCGPVKDEVIAFVKERHPEVAHLLEPPSEWKMSPEPAVHAFDIYGYHSPTWIMSMTLWSAHMLAVDGKELEEDMYDINLKYISPPPYVLWSGDYTESEGIVESGYSYRESEAERIDLDVARDLAFDFIVRRHEPIVVPVEGEWELLDVDEGIGGVKHDYRADQEGGTWRVGVRWDPYTASFLVDARYVYSQWDDYEEIKWKVWISADGERLSEWKFWTFFGV